MEEPKTKDTKAYQKKYWTDVLAPKRKAAAAARKAAKAAATAQEAFHKRRLLDLNERTLDALTSMEERRQRNAAIVRELSRIKPGEPLETIDGIDDLCEDGTSYSAQFWQWVQDFIDETSVSIGRHDHAALLVEMSKTDVGRAVLAYYGQPTFPDRQTQFVRNPNHLGVILSVKDLTDVERSLMESLERNWKARGRP